MKRKICGVGIKDTIGPTSFKTGYATREVCKWYQCWSDMIKKCYAKDDSKFQMIDSWLTASVFKKWHDANYIRGYRLNITLKVKGNTLYSPDTCLFVAHELILLFSNIKKSKSKLPTGVLKRGNRYQAFCNNPFEFRVVYLGSFKTQEDAYNQYCVYKNNIIEHMATAIYPSFEPYYQQHLLKTS